MLLCKLYLSGKNLCLLNFSIDIEHYLNIMKQVYNNNCIIPQSFQQACYAASAIGYLTGRYIPYLSIFTIFIVIYSNSTEARNIFLFWSSFLAYADTGQLKWDINFKLIVSPVVNISVGMFQGKS